VKKQKEKKDNIVVYYCQWVDIDQQYNQILLDVKPKSLMFDLQKRRAINPITPPSKKLEGGRYQSCSALHTLSNNMFIIKSPIDASIRLDDLGCIVRDSKASDLFIERISSIQNAFSLDFNISLLFFSEESVKMRLTPAYLHKTSHSSSGFVAAAEYDISSWFRSIACIFQLWPGVTSLEIKEDEPLLYLQFDTDKEIEFVQFKLTEDIVKMSMACGNFKYIKQFEPLANLYKRFIDSGLKKHIIKEIKNNAV
jgi:hypothetical protein